MFAAAHVRFYRPSRCRVLLLTDQSVGQDPNRPEDTPGGVADGVGVSPAPAGDVADAGRACIQTEQIGDDLGDGLSFGLLDPPVLLILLRWLLGVQDHVRSLVQ